MGLRISCLILLCSFVAPSNATKVFDSEFRKIGNRNSYFYDNNTFGSELYSDPTVTVKNPAFRNRVNSAVPCLGEWCDNKQFTCKKHGITDCYHVEHIIDSKENELFPPACHACKNVAGNRVMAWGRWNMAIGSAAQANYRASLLEKVDVYGKNQVITAAIIIAQCCSTFGVHGLQNSPLWAIISAHQNDNLAPTGIPSATNTSSNATVFDAACDCDPSDPSCDDDTDMCSCDSDSDCGCDCDFELTADAVITAGESTSSRTTIYLGGVAIALLGIVIIMLAINISLSRQRKISDYHLQMQLITDP